MKWVLGIFAGLLLLVGVGAGAYFLGKSSSAPDGEAAATAAAVPDPATPAESATDAPAAEGEPQPPRKVEEALKPPNWPRFSIELASFRSLDNARSYQAEMARRDLKTEMVEIVDAAGHSWYHIRVGEFDDPRQAAARMPDVERKAGLFGIVVTEIRPAGTEAQ